ncbi:MAG: glycosyltransferase family 39 protein [Candidatus Sulfotelmatobacter sp.]
MVAALLALLCAASGLFLVLLLWPRESGFSVNLLLKGSLSLGIGVGLFSVIFFVSRVSGGKNLLAVDLAVFLLLLAGYLFQRSRTGVANTSSFSSSLSNEKTASGWLLLTLRASFAIALLAALYSAVLRTIAHPHGDGWDAFAIWNLHARFLFRGGAHWRDGFTSLIPWSHPDYPLLLPAAIAHFWTGLGYESQIAPAVISLVFTFSTVALLFSSLASLRGQISAILGGLALLATPFFIQQGTAQYADVPLSFFVLATIVLLCLYDQSTNATRPAGLLMLAGISCGFAAWTKNEGLLFLLAILAARLLVFVITPSKPVTSEALPQPNRNAREASTALAFFLAGIAPLLLLVAWFKHSVAVSNELFSSVAFHKLLDASRYHAILKWYGKDFLRFGDWLLIPGTLLLVGLYFAVPGKPVPVVDPGCRASRIALALTLAGYFLIYLITPYDLYWHLRFSLNRLFLQLWPAAIFLFFLRNPGLNASPSGVESVSK